MTSTTPTVYCPACGRQIPADAGFCRECGHHLAARNPPAAAEPVAAPETRACPHCEAEVPVAAQFCGSCGKTMTVDDPPSEPATPLIPTLTPEPVSEPTPAADLSSPRREFNGRIVAIAAAGVLLLGGGIAAAVALSGGSTSKSAKAAHRGTRSDSAAVAGATPAATVVTAAPKATVESDTSAPSLDPALTAQLRKLDGLMQLSEQGRAAAVEGRTAAAIANRSTLLRQLQSLRADATDSRLQAAVDRFIAAIRESLRQNRECRSGCSAADLARVARLKRDALSELNPLLRKYVGRTYRLEDI